MDWRSKFIGVFHLREAQWFFTTAVRSIAHPANEGLFLEPSLNTCPLFEVLSALLPLIDCLTQYLPTFVHDGRFVSSSYSHSWPTPSLYSTHMPLYL